MKPKMEAGEHRCSCRDGVSPTSLWEGEEREKRGRREGEEEGEQAIKKMKKINQKKTSTQKHLPPFKGANKSKSIPNSLPPYPYINN